jgi:sulfatase modifying factor 1
MRSGRRLRFAIVAGLSAAVGCSLLTSLDELGGPADGSSPRDGSSDAGADADANPCPAAHGPAMVVVPSLNPAGSFCIDSTEVTEAQYKEFLVANVDAGSQIAECVTANASFVPSVAAECGQHPFDAIAHATWPVTCIDWCDAYAYCAWAGKRLCGEIGRGAGRVDLAHAGDPLHDQWFSACSAEGTRDYPYGAAYDASACNGLDFDAGGEVLPVGTVPGCVGGYPGIYDMSGNASEWEDSCTDASADAGATCQLRGGSMVELSGQLRCDQGSLVSRMATNYNQGFRCCADLL